MNMQSDIFVQQYLVDDLNNEAWKYRVQDSARAFTFSKDAVELAERIDYTKGKAEGYRNLAFSFIRLSRHSEANELLEKSLCLFRQLHDVKGESDVYEYSGIIKRSVGDYKASLEFLYKSLELRKQTEYSEGESLSLYHLGVTYKYLGEFDKALIYLLESLSIARAIQYWVTESYALNLIGLIYSETAEFTKARDYYFQSLSLRREAGDKWGEAGCLDNIGFTSFKLKQYQEAIDYCTESLLISKAISDKKGQGNALFHLANIYKEQNNTDNSKKYCFESLEIRREIGDKKGAAEILLFLAELQSEKLNKADREILFQLLGEALKLGLEVDALDLLSKIHFRYYVLYKNFGCLEDALLHLELFMAVEKNLHVDALKEKVENLEIAHQAEQSKNEAEIYRLRNIELAELYEESKRQKEEIEVQKILVEQSLFELKVTQKQLIQREKMASLGELTAGIAHEIQNPLNFMNNFSDVNGELIAELEKEIEKGNIKEAKAIANDIRENELKINHHGQRADAIVKGMLQHSRTNSGKKESTDINALADEYLRLSYHGLRAKDNGFSANFKTDFADHLNTINVVPQDIGRVLLNIYNNAFYSISEKKKQLNGTFEPTVFVSTRSVGNRIEITVRDNGMGIPQKVIDKIYQPFFTTKPAGQGTGLGLSLSYDIITKGHEGELKVETKEGEFAEFVIQLPVDKNIQF